MLRSRRFELHSLILLRLLLSLSQKMNLQDQGLKLEI